MPMPVSPIQTYLEQLHARHAKEAAGRVADYIPELKLADPNWFGICIATHDGHVYEVGDARQPFTMQSISKPLAYGMALEQHGEPAVRKRIGVEPSGDAFNAISLHPQTGTPLNPLINAGAIATCGLVRGRTADEKIAGILDTFSRYAGRPLQIDERIYHSESETGHRNRAIGWMLRNFGVLEDDPTPTLETYFRQCSIQVTCRDLALMGATLANGGVNPVTGVRAIPQAYVTNVLSVMATCGMYDASGEWLYRTGLPAKSGVGGGILAVQPGRLAIAVFSPPLDPQGNSVRGVAVCQDLSTELSLHLFDASQRGTPVVRMFTTRRNVTSKQRRPAAAMERLKGIGRRLRLYHLQGALVFASIEQVVRRLMDRSTDTEFFILNLRLVQGISPSAAWLIAGTRAKLAEMGRSLVISEAGIWWQALVDAGVPREAFFSDDDFALEHGENFLLERHYPEPHATDRVALGDCALFAGMADAELAVLDALLVRQTYARGQSIITAGHASDELFVITAGSAMVSIPTQDGVARLDALTGGMSFGEIAFLDRSPRSANVTALSPLECRVLTRAAFAQLGSDAPQIKIRLLENIALGLTRSVRQVSRELAALK
ncbi:MAG: glutaminase A [Rhodoferax sp.]|nr:glutaminase A [Rhodoferax sp.]